MFAALALSVSVAALSGVGVSPPGKAKGVGPSPLHISARLGFAEITAEEFKTFVATGATDAEVATWIEQHSKIKERTQVVAWNNKMRCTRLCDMPIELQEFLEGYIPKFIQKNRPVYVWFDVYDLEEKRI